MSTELSFICPIHEDARGIYSPEKVAALYPVDPRTGFPRTDLGRLTDPSLTNYEREKIMSRLEKIEGTYLPSELSDDDILDIIPSRFYVNDPVDIQRWRDYISEHIMPEMDRAAKQAALEAVGEPDEPNEPNKSNEPNNE